MIRNKNTPLNFLEEYLHNFDPRSPQTDPDIDEEWILEDDDEDESEDEEARKERIDLQNLYCKEED
jgi:hypothetical protein